MRPRLPRMGSVRRSLQRRPRRAVRPFCASPLGRSTHTSSTCPRPPRRPTLGRQPLLAAAGAAVGRGTASSA
eukprot:14883404-Alexandrium_andersonii.AAC.1